MLPDRVSNPGPLTYESGALPIALRGPAIYYHAYCICNCSNFENSLFFSLYYFAGRQLSDEQAAAKHVVDSQDWTMLFKNFYLCSDIKIQIHIIFFSTLFQSHARLLGLHRFSNKKQWNAMRSGDRSFCVLQNK